MNKKYKTLNRRIFKRNLKAVLNDMAKASLKYKSTLELWVDDYIKHCDLNGVRSGWYEVDSIYTKSRHAELIRTN